MNLIEGFWAAMVAIVANKLRSLLTVLGIVIGVSAVLGMIAVGDGAKTILINEAIRFGGVDNFSIYRKGWIRKSDRWVPNPSSHYFKLEDATMIEAGSPSVENVTSCALRHNGRVQSPNGSELRGVSFHGITPLYPFTRDVPIAMGRFLTDEDVAKRSRVTVLGWDFVEELFQNEDPIGKEVRLTMGQRGQTGQRGHTISKRFAVVGILSSKGVSMRQGWNLDDDLYLPVTTLQDRFIGNNHIDYFSIKAVTPEKVQQASKEVMEIITKHHNGQEEYYGTSITADFATGPLDKIRVVLQISLTSIAFISLVVGGIGIMNMVLVSVNERTREIGLRKALGAKKRDIFFQFLAESTLMSSVGGAIGIILGFFMAYGISIGLSHFITLVDEWPMVFPIKWAVISILFSASIGIGFGLYPAIRASSLQPVEALRIE